MSQPYWEVYAGDAFGRRLLGVYAAWEWAARFGDEWMIRTGDLGWRIRVVRRARPPHLGPVPGLSVPRQAEARVDRSAILALGAHVLGAAR